MVASGNTTVAGCHKFKRSTHWTHPNCFAIDRERRSVPWRAMGALSPGTHEYGMLARTPIMQHRVARWPRRDRYPRENPEASRSQ